MCVCVCVCVCVCACACRGGLPNRGIEMKTCCTGKKSPLPPSWPPFLSEPGVVCMQRVHGFVRLCVSVSVCVCLCVCDRVFRLPSFLICECGWPHFISPSISRICSGRSDGVRPLIFFFLRSFSSCVLSPGSRQLSGAIFLLKSEPRCSPLHWRFDLHSLLRHVRQC